MRKWLNFVLGVLLLAAACQPAPLVEAPQPTETLPAPQVNVTPAEEPGEGGGDTSPEEGQAGTMRQPLARCQGAGKAGR